MDGIHAEVVLHPPVTVDPLVTYVNALHTELVGLQGAVIVVPLVTYVDGVQVELEETGVLVHLAVYVEPAETCVDAIHVVVDDPDRVDEIEPDILPLLPVIVPVIIPIGEPEEFIVDEVIREGDPVTTGLVTESDNTDETDETDEAMIGVLEVN